jgi:hypothetical protein
MKEDIIKILEKYSECSQIEGILNGVDEFQFNEVAEEIDKLVMSKILNPLQDTLNKHKEE